MEVISSSFRERRDGHVVDSFSPTFKGLIRSVDKLPRYSNEGDVYYSNADGKLYSFIHGSYVVLNSL